MAGCLVATKTGSDENLTKTASVEQEPHRHHNFLSRILKNIFYNILILLKQSMYQVIFLNALEKAEALLVLSLQCFCSKHLVLNEFQTNIRVNNFDLNSV